MPINDWADYTDAIFSNDKVNCGYATTTLILHNRLFSTNQLNAVGGFLNSGDPRQLQMAESHLWAADKQGAFYDPSPQRSLLALKPTKAPEPLPTWPWYTFGGIGITAVGVYLGRNRLRNGASQAASLGTELVFKAAGPVLRSAYAASEHATWSKPDTPYNKQADMAAHHTSKTGREAFKILKDPTLHSIDTLERMKHQKHTTLARLAVRAARPAGERLKTYTGRHAPRRK